MKTNILWCTLPWIGVLIGWLVGKLIAEIHISIRLRRGERHKAKKRKEKKQKPRAMAAIRGYSFATGIRSKAYGKNAKAFGRKEDDE